MAGVAIPGGKGGRRPLDAEIALVPFIDLLCSLISFLLMTAVWAQVSRLEIKNGSDGPATVETAKQFALTLHIHRAGFTLAEQASNTKIDIACTLMPCNHLGHERDAQGKDVAKLQSSYDYERLESELQALKQRFPDGRDVTFNPADDVPYNEVVRSMDSCLIAGLDNVRLTGSNE